MGIGCFRTGRKLDHYSRYFPLGLWGDPALLVCVLHLQYVMLCFVLCQLSLGGDALLCMGSGGVGDGSKMEVVVMVGHRCQAARSVSLLYSFFIIALSSICSRRT